MDCMWVGIESWSMSQNCPPHSSRHSGLPQTSSALDTPWNFWGTTMAPLCSRIGLVGLVPKGRWRLSWKNRCYGWNLGSLIRNKFETLIQWMQASQFSSSKKSVPYTMFCEGNVHCGIWHWWVNTAPCYTSKPDGKRCLLFHIPAALLLSSTQEKRRRLVVQNPIILHDNAKNQTAAAVMDLLCSGNGRFWYIHRTHLIWIHAITISSPKRKNHCEGSGTTQEMNLPVL